MATLRLGIDATKAKAGADQFTQATNKVEKGANRAASATSKLGSASAKGGKDLKRTGFLVNQASNQIGDLATQVAMGTNVFRALGQQIPQLAGSFAILGGAMGIVLPILGVVAAVGFPIIAMFTSMGNKSETLSEKMNKLTDSIRDFRDRAQQARQPLSELEKEFGRFSEGIREMSIELSILEIGEQQRKMNAAVEEFKKVASVNIGQLVESDFEKLAKAARKGADLTDKEFRLFSGALLKLSRLQKTFALTREEAIIFAQQLVELQDPSLKDNPKELSLAYDKLGLAMRSIVPTSEEGEQALLELTRVVLEAKRGASGLALELENLDKFQMMRQSGLPLSQRKVQNAGLEDKDDDDKPNRSGASRIKAELKELENFAKKFKPVITLSQEYKNNLDKLNEARKRGAITEQEHAQAVAVATQQFQIGTGALVDYDSVANNFATTLGNNLMALVDGTMSVKDAFKSLATQVIKELYRVLVVQQIVNSAMGAFGYVPAAGGGYVPKAPITTEGAFGGPVGAGNGMVVGERGPEVFYPQSRGTIVPNNQAGGNVVVNQTFQFAANGDESVKKIIAESAPQIAKLTERSIMDQRRRGGQMKAVFG
tara:strand:+ start:458 stop:2257 length:1800 start_codon:yes stop_codon:yes gene_type:complete